MPLPYLDNPATLSETTVQELDGLVAKLNTFLRQQHTDQGGHGAITATSVVVDGPVTVRDERQFPSSFVRTLALGTRIDIDAPPTDTTPYLTIRYRNALNQPMLALVRLGLVGGGPNPTGPGLRLAPEAPGGIGDHAWDVLSASVFGGPALLFNDATNGDRPLIIVWTGDHYEVRRDVSVQEVWLGGLGGVTQRFERGYIQNLYPANIFERGRLASMGDWQDVPYNAADFLASGGSTWGVDAGDIIARRFSLIGQTLHYNVAVQTTDVTGAAPAQLGVVLPAGYAVGVGFVTPIIYSDAGGPLAMGYTTAGPGDTRILLNTLSGAPWTPTAADNTAVYITIAIEVTG